MRRPSQATVSGSNARVASTNVPTEIAREIDEALDAKDMPHAVRIAERALADGYRHPLLFHLRAVSRKQAGALKEARADLEQALQLATQSVPLMIEAADCLNALGEYGRAVELADAALARDAGQPVAWYQKGYGHQILGQFAQAEQALKACVRLDPGYADAHARLALLASGQNRLAEARSQADAALAADPCNAIARLARGAADLSDGRLDAARSSIEAVLSDPRAQGPERAIAKTQMGDLCHAMGRMDEAFDAYSDAGAIWKTYYGPHVLRPGTESATAQLGRLVDGLKAISPAKC